MTAMKTAAHMPQTAAFKNLRRMFWLRNVMAAVLTLAGWAAVAIHDIQIPVYALAGAVMLMMGLNAGTWWRLGYATPASDLELLTQLLLDMSILTGLFYATGGYTNPFVWMYLLPITVAAVALPLRHTWLIAGLAVACYSALMFWYQPLAMPAGDMGEHAMHMQHDSGFSVHLLGMWAGFVVSAVVIAFFVERMANTLREYDHMLADAREKLLESERMLALGSLATGAAHELGTPLATMAVLCREMQEDHAGDTELAHSLAVMRKQIDRCKEILSSLAASAGQARPEDSQGMALDRFIEQMLERWRDVHPALHLDCTLHGTLPAPLIMTDRTLGQALVNLIDNAGDAARERVQLDASWDESILRIDIHDDGPGLSPEIAHQVGTPFFTTKQDRGMGLGLYLARTILERFDGSVTLENHPQGGALTQVYLPLAHIKLKATT